MEDETNLEFKTQVHFCYHYVFPLYKGSIKKEHSPFF